MSDFEDDSCTLVAVCLKLSQSGTPPQFTIYRILEKFQSVFLSPPLPLDHPIPRRLNRTSKEKITNISSALRCASSTARPFLPRPRLVRPEIIVRQPSKRHCGRTGRSRCRATRDQRLIRNCNRRGRSRCVSRIIRLEVRHVWIMALLLAYNWRSKSRFVIYVQFMSWRWHDLDLSRLVSREKQ